MSVSVSISDVNCQLHYQQKWLLFQNQKETEVLIYKAYMLCISETIGLFNMLRFLTVARQDLVDNPLDHTSKRIDILTWSFMEDVREKNPLVEKVMVTLAD